ncbi:DEBR0S1_16842g1_1 [Brettanomyces bruxellensis]|uniref:DEBR0S1_16842g1_1 n=1 Tax=Dekkera bruxellensis TaxID=5007 RepID=A0A3F2Y9Z4_DEKBR|nr:DEBR0S1_16842g1_1 [Brettanomyces bruxellensis]
MSAFPKGHKEFVLSNSESIQQQNSAQQQSQAPQFQYLHQSQSRNQSPHGLRHLVSQPHENRDIHGGYIDGVVGIPDSQLLSKYGSELDGMPLLTPTEASETARLVNETFNPEETAGSAVHAFTDRRGISRPEQQTVIHGNVPNIKDAHMGHFSGQYALPTLPHVHNQEESIQQMQQIEQQLNNQMVNSELLRTQVNNMQVSGHRLDLSQIGRDTEVVVQNGQQPIHEQLQMSLTDSRIPQYSGHPKTALGEDITNKIPKEEKVTSQFLETPMFEEQEFDDVNVLKKFVKEFGRKNRFGIAIAHSNSKAIYFTCELGGGYRHKRVKRSGNGKTLAPSKRIGSKKIHCPFAMVATFSKKRQYWTLRITQNKHNHPRLNPLLNFPMLRKRSPRVNGTISYLYRQGDKPSVIQKKLENLYPSLIIKREDIYNEVRILKKKGLVPTNPRARSKNSRIQLHSEQSLSPSSRPSTSSFKKNEIWVGQQLTEKQNAHVKRTVDSLPWNGAPFQNLNPNSNNSEIQKQTGSSQDIDQHYHLPYNAATQIDHVYASSASSDSKDSHFILNERLLDDN